MVAAGGWLILAGVNDAGYNYLSAKITTRSTVR
jgi:hypothetical protein